MFWNNLILALDIINFSFFNITGIIKNTFKVRKPKKDKFMDSPNIEVKLQVAFLKEGNYIIAYSPALDLSAYGNTEKKARQSFEETFLIFIEETLEKGTLLNELLKLGWELKKEKFIPPPILTKKDITKRISSILASKDAPKFIKSSFQEVCIPAT